MSNTKGAPYYYTPGVFTIRVATAFAAALFLLINSTWAQVVTAKLDRDKIVMGEQVTLELKLEGLNADSAFIISWFNLPDTANHIQVIRRDTTDTIVVAGLTSYLQHITITSFDSGRWAIQLPKLTLQNKATGKKNNLVADSVFLQVLPADVSALKDYHDLKDIIEVPAQHNYGLLIGGVLSAIAVIILTALLLSRRKKTVVAPPGAPASLLGPLDEALQKIYDLKIADLPASGQTKLFYTRLDDIIRTYVYKRIHARAMQYTSDELVLRLGVYLQNQEIKTKFIQLLRLADAVKFAKYTPDYQQYAEALQYAAAALQYIDVQFEIANRHVN